MRLISLLFVFLVCTGMKLILRDGNFIEVKSYKAVSGKVYFQKKGKSYYLPEYMVDRESTKRLRELESKKISLFKSYTAVSNEKGFHSGDILRYKDKAAKKEGAKNGASVKLETRKEANPFFIDFDAEQNRDENFVEKLKRKGVFFKIQIPVKKD